MILLPNKLVTAVLLFPLSRNSADMHLFVSSNSATVCSYNPLIRANRQSRDLTNDRECDLTNDREHNNSHFLTIYGCKKSYYSSRECLVHLLLLEA